MRFDVAIIGGGASGVMAALAAKQTNAALSVAVLEKNPRVLRKLLATGNGRCNFTNEWIVAERYYGEDAAFAMPALQAFGAAEARAFFAHLGVPSVVLEKGKIFPMSLQAASVADALRFEAERVGVEMITGFAAQSARGADGSFAVLSADKRMVQAGRLIMAAGGCASPELGADGSGYALMERFGHAVTKLSPALMQLKTEKSIVHGLQGVKLDARVSFWSGGQCVGTAQDELLFTEQGLSGAVIFELSVLWHRFSQLAAQVDFLPDIEEAALLRMLAERRTLLGHLTLENFANGLIHKKLGQALTKLAGVEKLSMPISALPDEMLAAMAAAMKRFTVAITGAPGFKNAQVTAGGVRTRAFDAQTMESKLVPGLYAAGELLDIYGDCGGFNLQWAWASGYAAGRSAAMK